MTPYRILYLLLTVGVSPPMSILIESGDIPRVPAVILPPLMMAAVAILAEVGAAMSARVQAVVAHDATVRAATTGEVPPPPPPVVPGSI